MSKTDLLLLGLLVLGAGGVVLWEKNRAAVPARVLAPPSPGVQAAPSGYAPPSSGGGVLADVNAGVDIASKLYDLGSSIWGDN